MKSLFKRERWMVFLLFLLMFPSILKGQSFTYEGIKYSIINQDEKTVMTASGSNNSSGNNISGDLILPDSVYYDKTRSYYKLVLIGYKSFSSCDITSVVIGPSVTRVGSHAFFDCKQLSEVNIPSSVTEIYESAFAKCVALKEVHLPTSVSILEQRVFEDSGLQKIVLSDSLKRLEYGIFSGCSDLAEVKIPSSVTFINGGTFSGCSSLTEINIPSSISHIGYNTFENCTGLKEVTIPSSVTSIEYGLFSGCTNLKKVAIPSTVTKIGGRAFYGCTNLTDVVIPSSVTIIESAAFYGCNGPEKYDIPPSVSSIGSAAFQDNNGLRKIIFPDIPKNIAVEELAFSGCPNLDSVIIPSSIEIKTKGFKGIFQNSKIDKFIILGDYNSSYFSNLNVNSHVFCKRADIEQVKRNFYGEISAIDPYEVIYEPLLKGVSFRLGNPNHTIYGNLKDIEMNVSLHSETGLLKEMQVKPDETYLITDLEQNQTYKLYLSWTNSEFDSKVSYTFSPMGIFIVPKITATQTTISLTVNYASDASLSPTNRYLEIDGKRYDYEDKPIVITGLEPNSEYIVSFYADYDGEQRKYSRKVKTKGINIEVTGEADPTSAILHGKYDAGDAEVEIACWKLGYKFMTEAETLELTGLSPDTPYTYQYEVTVKGGKKFYKELPFRTKKLQLEMMDPKCTSATTAIVAAKTNISEMEPNVGFQWKKYDAPASLKPSTGYAAVYDGMLEGQIKNLQTASYYNVRAFYKNADDKYYYTDWVTFDPSDFSYFEPTVHTYPIQSVGSDNAILKGYVLEGTDIIISQGFQYWISESQMTRADNLSNDKMQTVTASGQIMTAVIDNLKPGSTYFFRAFVETATGLKFGEEQTFSTSGDSAVWEIEADEENAEIIGYYDICGRRYDSPQKGLNIIVYSNGKSRKTIIR